MKSPFRGFGAVLYKEFKAVLRDPLTLFFMFFPPLVEMIAFGYALDNDIKNMSLVVYDQDRTVESRQLVDRFANTGTFRVTGEAQSLEDVRTIMRRGKAWAALQIPPDFTRELRAGRTAHVQVLIDGSSSTPALQALNTALAVTLRQSVVSLLGESGRTQVPIEVRPQVLRVRPVLTDRQKRGDELPLGIRKLRSRHPTVLPQDPDPPGPGPHEITTPQRP